MLRNGNGWQLSKLTECLMTFNDFKRMNWSDSRNRCYQTLCSSLATDVANAACFCDVAASGLLSISGRACGGVACLAIATRFLVKYFRP